MSGPTLDQARLQSQVDWLTHHGPISWQNFRYSGLLENQTDQNGTIWVYFEPAFTTELLGFACSLDFSGGVERWDVGFWDVSRWAFGMNVWDPDTLGPISNAIVGIYYLAVGR